MKTQTQTLIRQTQALVRQTQTHGYNGDTVIYRKTDIETDRDEDTDIGTIETKILTQIQTEKGTPGKETESDTDVRRHGHRYRTKILTQTAIITGKNFDTEPETDTDIDTITGMDSEHQSRCNHYEKDRYRVTCADKDRDIDVILRGFTIKFGSRTYLVQICTTLYKLIHFIIE